MRLGGLAAFAAAVTASAALSMLAAQAQISDDVVKIGVMNDMSGLYADISGQGSAEAARMAIASPLLDVSMDGARGVLFNVTGGSDLMLNEIHEAAELIGQAADPDANIIFGAVIDPSLQGEIKITVIATGFDQPRPAQPRASGDRSRRLRLPDGDSDDLEPRIPSRVPARERPPILEDEDDLDVPAFLRRRRPER
jgi:cell division protein FtsZ